MTRGPQSPSRELAAEASADPHRRHEAVVLDELVHLGPPSVPAGEHSAWHAFSPLVSWLIASTRPGLTVEWGPGDRTSLLATCDAVARVGAGARCVAARLRTAAPGGSEAFADAVAACAAAHPGLVNGDAEAGRTPMAAEESEDGQVGLLHVSLFGFEGVELDELPTWMGACGPGAVIVVTTTDVETCADFQRAEDIVAGRCPVVRLPLGGSTAAVVAQVPVSGAVPVVELLRGIPASVGRYLTALGQPAAELEHLGDEALPAQTVRTVMAGLLERREAERGALLAAVGAYRDYTAGLAAQLDEARRSLTAQERLVEEFLDRLDELSAKISTSAARFTAQLEEKDRLLEAEERKVLDYAGQAADARSVIDDMRQSSSWRMTAPLRLLSRYLARRRTPHAG